MSTHLGQQTGPDIPEGMVFCRGVSEVVKEALCPLSPASSGLQGPSLTQFTSRLGRIVSLGLCPSVLDPIFQMTPIPIFQKE